MSLLIQKHGEAILQGTRSNISQRYRTVTRAMNREFWNIQSERKIVCMSALTGVRQLSTRATLIFWLSCRKANTLGTIIQIGNGQSRLLQAVKSAIQTAYPRSDVKADGQVVKIAFSDDMQFEILPAFKQLDSSYQYPDTNMDENWKATDPKAEQVAMRQKNNSIICLEKIIRYIVE
jgi:hypothetical protein